MRVGYSQTGPWFYKDAKTGELGGIYKDVVERLAKEMQVKVEWKEVTFQNSTVGLRRGRLRPVRLVADLHDRRARWWSTTSGRCGRRAASLMVPQGQRRSLQDGGRLQQART